MEAARQRKKRGDESAEGDKQAMLKALQERRTQTAPDFVQDQQQRSAKYLNDIRAGARGMQANWRKVAAGVNGLAELNKECWDRENLLQTEQPASKRFKRALEKVVPCPIVLDEDDEQ